MSNIFFVDNSLFINAWGVPDRKQNHFGDLGNLHPSRAFLIQNVSVCVLSKFLIQDFDPKMDSGEKKSLPIDSDMIFVTDLKFSDHSEKFSASNRGFISRSKKV